jgi:hypothetical protein
LSTSANSTLSNPCLARQNLVFPVTEKLASLCLMQVRSFFWSMPMLELPGLPGPSGEMVERVLVISYTTKNKTHNRSGMTYLRQNSRAICQPILISSLLGLPRAEGLTLEPSQAIPSIVGKTQNASRDNSWLRPTSFCFRSIGHGHGHSHSIGIALNFGVCDPFNPLRFVFHRSSGLPSSPSIRHLP